jgi:hypothetical protein
MGFGGLQDGVADVLGLERVAEVGFGRFSRAQAFEEVGEGIDEGVLVADRGSRHPPFAHVGVLEIGHVNGAPAARGGVVPVVEILEAMRILEVERDRGVLAVDLEGVLVFAAAGVAGGLEGGEDPFENRARKAQASSIPTFCFLPVIWCVRSLMNVSVMR